LRRSNSLNDVEGLKQEEVGRIFNGSNSGNSSGSRQGKRHTRKGSEQIEKAMSVHKIKASISDESAISRAKKKKFRDSKKRTSEEDPFSLLLSKNELFLKVLQLLLHSFTLARSRTHTSSLLCIGAVQFRIEVCSGNV